MRKAVVLAGLFALLAAFLPLGASPTSAVTWPSSRAIPQPSAPHMSPGKDSLVRGARVVDPFNTRLAIQVGSDGRFNIGAFPDATTGGATANSWDLMYSWPR